MDSAAYTPPPPREEVDRLILPSLGDRIRDAFGFMVASQSVYAVSLLLSRGPAFELRGAINFGRLAVLGLCLFLLRRDGTRRRTLAIASAGLTAQFLAGIAISVVRQDVMPMMLLLSAFVCIGSVLIPWGPLPQTVMTMAAAASIAAASNLLDAPAFQPLGPDTVATVATIFGLSIYIAHTRERARLQLVQRLDEARRADEELAALRAQLEKRVAERTAELEMANRELEGFSYTVSHDLRSPLRTIAGFSQLVLADSGANLDDTARENLTKIHAASRRMDGLIDDMLLLARVGRSALRYESVDLSAIARSVGAELAAENPGRSVSFTVEDLPQVPGDHGLLRIVLDNLLRNAWKFTSTREDPWVHVFGRRVGDAVVCCVEDNGVGFDPRFQAKLFQPFQRIHSDERFPGTGVGLATVARIVQRHGGTAHAEGSVDGGATFSVTLPLQRPG